MIHFLRICGERKQRGFTLIEVLVSLFILSIVFSILYGTFFTTHRVLKDLESRMAGRRTLRAALQVISEDLRSTYLSPAGTVTRFKGEDFTKKIITPFLSFTTYTSYQREGSLYALKVEYLLEKRDKTGNLTLIRRTLEKNSRDVMDEEELVEGIETLQLSYFDGKEWKKEWDSEIAKNLPGGIELIFSVDSFTLSSIIPIEGGQFG